MSYYEEIPIDLIDPPENPLRTTSTGESLEELIASIEVMGLLQPIGVTLHPTGRYEIRWGMRRTLAHRHLNKKKIKAIVHEPGEGDGVLEMAAENFQRTQMSEAEECAFFIRYMEHQKINAAQAATLLKVSYPKILRAQHIMEGDPKVVEAFQANAISAAQAAEIVLIRDQTGRDITLLYAAKNDMTAKSIRAWREQREQNGVSLGLEELKQVVVNNAQQEYANLVRCHFCQEFHPIEITPMRHIGEDCWTTIHDIVRQWTEMKKAQEGKGN